MMAQYLTAIKRATEARNAIIWGLPSISVEVSPRALLKAIHAVAPPLMTF